MHALLDTIHSGTRLFVDLRDLLAQERDALAGQRLQDLDTANREREALLAAISEWRRAADEQAPGTTDGSTERPLSAAVSRLEAPDRKPAETALAELRRVAEEARHMAAVNHILVERSLDTVESTLDFFVGGSRTATYDAQGGVARKGAQQLIGRKG